MQSLLVVIHHLTTCGGHTPVCQYLKKINQSINAKSRSLCPSANVFSFSSGWGVSLQQNADRMAFLPLPLIVFRALLTRYRALFFAMSPTRKEDHCVNWYPIWDKLSWSIVKKTSVFLLTYPRNCRFGERTSGCSRQRFWTRWHLVQKRFVLYKILTLYTISTPLTAGQASSDCRTKHCISGIT